MRKPKFKVGDWVIVPLERRYYSSGYVPAKVTKVDTFDRGRIYLSNNPGWGAISYSYDQDEFTLINKYNTKLGKILYKESHLDDAVRSSNKVPSGQGNSDPT